MRLLSIVCGTLAVLSLRPTAVLAQTAETALHYNDTMFKYYVRVTQQLRGHLKKTREGFALQMEDITADIGDINQQLESQLNVAMEAIAELKQRLAALHLTISKIMTPMVLAESKDPYTDAKDPIFGSVVLDHSMGYDGSTGNVLISVPGIYMLDYKAQSADTNAFYCTIEVFSSSGIGKISMRKYIDWEISPFFEMWNLDAGDRVSFKSLYESDQNSLPSDVTGGSATQFSLSYLGRNA